MKKEKTCPITCLYQNFTHELKELQHRQKMLKLKIFLLVVLPLLTVFLLLKVAQTYLRIKIRKLVMGNKARHKEDAPWA